MHLNFNAIPYPCLHVASHGPSEHELAKEQHPAELGPTVGPWRLQDPQDNQRVAASVLAADLATAMQAGTWAPGTPLLIIFGDEDLQSTKSY